MQVDRQRSAWPSVVMLAGLMMLCLMAPRYWRNAPWGFDSHSVEPRADSPSKPYLPFAWDPNRRWQMPSSDVHPEFDPLHLWAAPTLEELVARRIGVRPPTAQFQLWHLDMPPLESQNNPHPERGGPLNSDALSPEIFKSAGRILAEFSPSVLLAELPKRIADWCQAGSASRGANHQQTETVSSFLRDRKLRDASSLRLNGPNDRLAMNPQRSAETSSDLETSERWCVPQVLFDQLQRLSHHPESALWARQTADLLVDLTARARLDGDDVQPILTELNTLAAQAIDLADETDDDRLRVELLRAHWALARRIDCWTSIYDIRVAELASSRVALHGPIESFFHSPSNQRQRVEIFHNPTINIDLETYERTRHPALGRQIVQQKQSLEASPEPFNRSLAESVERHYRNANVRIAISGQFLNRIVAQERSDMRSVRERIAGTPVQGSAHMHSASRVRLEPAADRWQLTVEADGLVDSNTLANGGSARLRSQSATDFSVRKSVRVDSSGVQLQNTIANANNRSRLVGVTTDFDWIPVVGSFARDRAVSEYHARRARARAEIEMRVSNQAIDQVDRETLDAVERIQQRVRERLTDRLSKSGVELTPIEMTTTQERVVGRFRIAGVHQLGSHTPRPRALSDSLASLQVHESAITNAAVTLSLDGRRCTGDELAQVIRESFPSAAKRHADSRHEAVFQFADRDAVQLHIDEGRLELTLSLAAVEQGGRTMRNVLVHAYYVPVANGLSAELVRDGSLGIEGRLSSGQRARLHNVFDAVLPPERRLSIVQLDNLTDRGLDGLMITQLVFEDGWMGIAIGPILNERVAERSRSLR